MDSARNIVFTICGIQSGSTYNVFPDSAVLTGSIRSFDKVSLAKMKNRITEVCTDVAKGCECKAKVEIIDSYPATVNHKEPTEHVIRLAK